VDNPHPLEGESEEAMGVDRKWAAAAALCASLAACGGGGGGDNLRVSLRLPGGSSRAYRAVAASAVRITITGVRVHYSDTAAPADPGWVDCGTPEPRLVDLLALGTGALELCGDRIPDGYYRQVWVDVAQNAAGAAPVNTFVTDAGEELPLEVPAGGFGADYGFLVGGGGVDDIALVVDAARSVERRPVNRFLFLPGVRVDATKVYGAVSP
jgi:hypothetical protein